MEQLRGILVMKTQQMMYFLRYYFVIFVIVVSIEYIKGVLNFQYKNSFWKQNILNVLVYRVYY